MTGYSETTLKDKLGLTSEMSAYYLRAPTEYWQELGIKQAAYDDYSGEYEFIHAFFTSKQELSNFADMLVSKLSHGGIMWISWPRLPQHSEQAETLTNSAVQSDITEQDLRDIFLPLGLVDTKACEVTDIWHGLKFVWREDN